MGWRRESSTLDDLFNLFKHLPWFVGPIFAAILFLFLRFLVPILGPRTPINTAFAPLWNGLAWIVAGAVLLAWIAAEVHKFANRFRLNTQTGHDSIRGLTWQHFEQLVAEAYRRRGYMAEVVDQPAGDGGVDIVLTDLNGTLLVQCKQWRQWKVGVKPVRELLGVVTSVRAVGGILVTSGRFTRDAIEFARANPSLQLIDGPDLSRMIAAVQRTPTPAMYPQSTPTTPVASPAVSPACPVCNRPMVRRTARRGQHAGGQFWGCEKFPRCRGTRFSD